MLRQYITMCVKKGFLKRQTTAPAAKLWVHSSLQRAHAVLHAHTHTANSILTLTLTPSSRADGPPAHAGPCYAMQSQPDRPCLKCSAPRQAAKQPGRASRWPCRPRVGRGPAAQPAPDHGAPPLLLQTHRPQGRVPHGSHACPQAGKAPARSWQGARQGTAAVPANAGGSSPASPCQPTLNAVTALRVAAHPAFPARPWPAPLPHPPKTPHQKWTARLPPGAPFTTWPARPTP